MKPLYHLAGHLPAICLALAIIFILPPKGRNQNLSDPEQFRLSEPISIQVRHSSFADLNYLPVTPHDNIEDKERPVSLENQPRKEEDVTIRVSPNPVTSSANIRVNSNNHEKYDLYIYNFIGEKVRTIKGIFPGHLTFDRDDLQAGIYFIQLFRKNKGIATTKMIIQ